MVAQEIKCAKGQANKSQELPQYLEGPKACGRVMTRPTLLSRKERWNHTHKKKTIRLTADLLAETL